jgi:hypothetical protein
MYVISFFECFTLPDDGLLQKPKHVTTNCTARYYQTVVVIARPYILAYSVYITKGCST